MLGDVTRKYLLFILFVVRLRICHSGRSPAEGFPQREQYMNMLDLRTTRERMRQRVALELLLLKARNVKRWEAKLGLLDYPDPVPLLAALQYALTRNAEVKAATERHLLETAPDLLPFTRSTAGSKALLRHLEGRWKLGNDALPLIAEGGARGDYKYALLQAATAGRGSKSPVLPRMDKDDPFYPIYDHNSLTRKIVARHKGDLDLYAVQELMKSMNAKALRELRRDQLSAIASDPDAVLVLSMFLPANAACGIFASKPASKSQRVIFLTMLLDHPEYFRAAPDRSSNGYRIWEFVRGTLLDQAKENREVLLQVWADRSPLAGRSDLMDDLASGADLSPEDLVRRLLDLSVV